MSVKIRLQRQGRKKAPYYHIVVADSRAPRDGKFIENIGYYKPQTVPATIELNVEKAAEWLGKGAQPTDTCRAILSYKGVLFKHHLQGGVRKGAMTQEQADATYAAWIAAKEQKVVTHTETHKQTLAEKRAAALALESKVKEARAQKLAAKLAAEEAAKVPAQPEVVAEVETPAAEETPVATVETPVVEEAPVVKAEAPAVEETPVAETEAPAAESTEKPTE